MRDSGEFGRGWRVVLASCIGVGTGLAPIPFYTIGVFIRPLSAEFGWRVDQILAALIVLTLTVLIAAPVVGMMTDRYGVRRVALASVTLFGLCFVLFALNPGSLILFYVNYALLALLGSGTLPITWTRAVNNWFNEKRGLALGLSLLSTGIFGSIAKLYANFMIGQVGWRLAYVGLAAFPLLIALPVAIAFFHDRDERSEGDDAGVRHAGLTLRMALLTRQFWTMAISFIVMTLCVGGIIPNLEALLGSKGFDAGNAVGLASIIGVAVVIGRPVGGWLVDKIWAPAVAFVILSAPAIAFALLSGSAPSAPVAAFGVFLIGFASGVEYDVVAYLVSRYFGMQAYGAIYGSLYAAFALGAGSGPYLMGHIFTTEKTYDGALALGATVLVAGAALLLTLGRYPVFRSEPEREPRSEVVPSVA